MKKYLRGDVSKINEKNVDNVPNRVVQTDGIFLMVTDSRRQAFQMTSAKAKFPSKGQNTCRDKVSPPGAHSCDQTISAMNKIPFHTDHSEISTYWQLYAGTSRAYPSISLCETIFHIESMQLLGVGGHLKGVMAGENSGA